MRSKSPILARKSILPDEDDPMPKSECYLAKNGKTKDNQNERLNELASIMYVIYKECQR